MKNIIYSICLLLISINIQAQDTIIIKPGPTDGIDASIRTDHPTINYGDDHNFIANAWTWHGDFFIQRSLIYFDLSVIPENSVILHANLSLYCNITSGHHQLNSGENECYLQRITSSWDEYSVNWDNQPLITTHNQIRISRSNNTTQNYPNINATALIIDMINNPNNSFGFMIKLQTEATYRCMVFASSDHIDESIRPKLEITYLWCEPPIAEFSYSFSDKEVIFFDLSSSAQSWFWDFADGFYSDLQNPTHTYDNYNTYYVCLTVEDSCGTDTYCDSIYLCQLPTAEYCFSIFDKQVNFTNLSTDVFLFYWDFGDSSYSDLKNPTHIYNNYGTYYVCLTVEDSCGTDTYCDSIYLCQLPTAEYCFSIFDKQVNFTNLSTDVFLFYWDFGDSSYSDLKNPTHIYNNYGTYYVCLTVEDSCGTDTYCDSIYLCQFPIADYDYFIIDKLINFTNLSTEALSFFWDFGDGSVSFLENPSHEYIEYRSFNVCLIVQNTCSSDTLCDTVNIIYNKPDDFYLKVYPNPTLRFINIEFGNLCMENTEIIVTDEIGKIIHSGKLIKSNENNTCRIDLYNQASGVYFLQIKNENYNSIIKIVRQY